MSFIKSKKFNIALAITLALGGASGAYFMLKNKGFLGTEPKYRIVHQTSKEKEEAYDLAWYLIDLMKEINDTYTIDLEDGLKFTTSKMAFQKLENKLNFNCSNTWFTPRACAIANRFKRKCEIRAKLAIATSGMTNKEYVEFKRENLALFESLVESQAKCYEAEEDLEALMPLFVIRFGRAFTEDQKQNLKSHLHNCLLGEILQHSRASLKAKEQSQAAKLPVLAWSYLELNKFLTGEGY